MASIRSIVQGVLMAGATAALLVPGGALHGQLARQTSNEKILVINPVPVNGADSAYAVALADALRNRLIAKYRFRLNIVPTEDYCAVLEASGYNCLVPINPSEAAPLARVLQASGYVVPWLRQGQDSVELTIRMVDVSRSGLSGWERVTAAAGAPAEDLAGKTTDQLNNRVRAAEFSRECEERRERNDPRGAVQRAAKAFEIFPNHPSAAACVALAHEVARQPVDSIIAALRKQVAGDSLNKRGWQELSRRLVEKGDTAGAVAAAVSELKADPVDGGLRARVAGALIAEEKYREAVTILDEGLASNPGDMPLLALKERACVEGEIWTCAMEAMEGRFSIDTTLATDSVFYTGVFAAAQSAEDTAAMLQWSERMVQRFPGSVSAWRARAASVKLRDDRVAALEAYDRILALDSTQVASALAAAQYLLDSTLVVDTLQPLDTARLLKGERLLDLVAARSRADTTMLLNVAFLLYNPASRVAPLTSRGGGVFMPHAPMVQRFLEKALQYDLRGQLRLPTNFYLGLVLFFQIAPLDAQVRETKSCELVEQELTMTANARQALTTGRSVHPPTVDQLLGYVGRYEEAQKTYKPVFKCP